jgi:LysM repeat protein
MKSLPLLASLTLSALMAPALAETGVESLERRCAEQERQIRQLEAENSRLRSLLTTAESVPAVAEPAAAERPASDEASYYTVREGDTLSKIARRHQTRTAELVRLNQLKDAGLIRPGQKLRLPVAERDATPAAEESPVPAPAAPSSPTHTVQAGETFFSIARQHGLSPDRLAAANPDADPRGLRIGQVLQLGAEAREPEAEPTTSPVVNKPVVRSVTIDEEITFAAFADSHGTDPAKLNALNGLNLDPQTVLAKGSELYVSAQP